MILIGPGKLYAAPAGTLPGQDPAWQLVGTTACTVCHDTGWVPHCTPEHNAARPLPVLRMLGSCQGQVRCPFRCGQMAGR